MPRNGGDNLVANNTQGFYKMTSVNHIYKTKLLPKKTSRAVLFLYEGCPVLPLISLSLSSTGFGRACPEGVYVPSWYAGAIRRNSWVSAG